MIDNDDNDDDDDDDDDDVTLIVGLQVVRVSSAEVVRWAESVVTSHSRVKTTSVDAPANISSCPASAVSRCVSFSANISANVT